MVLRNWDFLKGWPAYYWLNISAVLVSAAIAVIGIILLISSVSALRSDEPVENAGDKAKYHFGKGVFGILYTAAGYLALIVGPIYCWLGYLLIALLAEIIKTHHQKKEGTWTR